MARKTGLHLPDCSRVQFPEHGKCDCGTPPSPLPINKKLIRVKGRIRMVAKHAKGVSIFK